MRPVLLSIHGRLDVLLAKRQHLNAALVFRNSKFAQRSEHTYHRIRFNLQTKGALAKDLLVLPEQVVQSCRSYL